MSNGALTPIKPLPATPVPVMPSGKVTATSNVRLAGVFGAVGEVTEISGEPASHITGALLVATAFGVGSTITVVGTGVPLAQPLNSGVTVKVTVMKASLLLVSVPLIVNGKG